MMLSLLRVAGALLAGFVAVSNAVHTVEVRGQDFVDTVTQKRLKIIGVDYQPGGQAGYNPIKNRDPLSNGTVCLRDAALLQRLGANTIRVYNIDPKANHDECASIFNAVGIYMILDVNSPFGGESLDRSNPSSSYHVGYLTRIFGIVEAFKNYPNTLGFFAANEVINDVPTGKDNPRYIRAVQRDLKNYIANHSPRKIPVGYSAADVRVILQDQSAYFQCAIDGDAKDPSRSDFFGVNSYSWCGGDATFQSAGYDVLVKIFGNSTFPVFFSEYGCNEVKPRVFDEVQAIYGSNMTALSGGLVYEYSQETSDFGLVNINDNGTITLRTDFNSLQSQFNKLDIALIESTNSSATSLVPPPCSSALISDSGLSKDFDIPDPPPGAADLIKNGVSNPMQGKIVPVTKTEVPMAVYGTNGVAISNLALKPLANDQTNTPSGENTEQGSSTGTSSPKKKGGAAIITPIGFLSCVLLVLTTMLSAL